jgi:proline iminopeptidase
VSLCSLHEATAQGADATRRPGNSASATSSRAALPDSLAAVLEWSRRAKDATRRSRTPIDTAVGIDELATVRLNGIQHVTHIRGVDRRNPVLLFVHGGPRDPIMPEAHLFQNPLEHAFTVVQWDQRCVGKTYFANEHVFDCATVSADLMYRDLELMVDHLRRRFGGRKIVLLGHSWGTMLGTTLARRHPEWLSAYVGVGQVTSLRAMAEVTLRELQREATQRGDADILTSLRTTRIYPRDTTEVLAGRREITLAMHRYGWSFRGNGPYPDYASSLIDLVMRSPEYSLEDATYFTAYQAMVIYKVLQESAFDTATLGNDFAVPMLIGMGSHDLHTPYPLVKSWFDGLRAPEKQFHWFQNSAHSPFLDEPAEFARFLLDVVGPVARRRAQ